MVYTSAARTESCEISEIGAATEASTSTGLRLKRALEHFQLISVSKEVIYIGGNRCEEMALPFCDGRRREKLGLI